MPPQPRIQPIARPLTAKAVRDALKDVHERIAFDLRAEGKTDDWVPAWYVHLPSGEKVRIKWVGRDGPLVRFITRDGLRIFLAPDAVVVTIEPPPEDTEGFPVEFLEPEDDES